MDEATLGAARSAENTADLRLAGRISRGVASGEKAPRSVAALQRERAEREQALQAEAESFFERGLSFEQQGNAATARIYYKMAYKRGDDALRQRVTAHLARLARK
jgi:hypothetical protein